LLDKTRISSSIFCYFGSFQVRKALEQASRFGGFTIASTHYGGSIGKNTDVQAPDFDIVMKINDRLPPFTSVLNSFQRTLQQQANILNIKPHTIRLTPFSIQFSFTNGMAVDLLPASAQLTEEQVLQQMKGSRKNRRYYNSSLVEQQVDFMKQQSAFAHAVARLAKYWYKSIDITYYVSGASTIFENLAVAAVMEEGHGRESMYSAFMRVVKKVENLDQLQLAFEKQGVNSWKVSSHLVHGQRIPYLMEPTNPTNNILQGMKPQVKDILKSNAHSMGGRLQNLMDKREYCCQIGTGVQIDFNRLFQ